MNKCISLMFIIVLNSCILNKEKISTELNKQERITDSLILLSDIFFQEKKYENAITNLKKVIELNKKHDSSYVLLAQNYAHLYNQTRQLKYFKKAEQSYKKAILLKSNNIHYIYSRALFYFYNSKWNEALKSLNRILQIDVNNVKANQQIAIIHDLNDQYQIALRYINIAISADSLNSKNLYVKSVILKHLGDESESEIYKQKAFDLGFSIRRR